MTAAIGLREIAEFSALRMFDCLIAGTVIALGAAVLSRACSRQSPAVRFGIWFLALLAIPTSLVFASGRGLENSPIPSGARAQVMVPGSWAVGIFAAWAVVSAFLLLRIGLGIWRLRRLRTNVVCVPEEGLQPELREVLGRLGDEVPLYTSDCVQVPSAIGFWKRAVVLPRWALVELSTDELKHILLHEVEHLRRHDLWTNLSQQVIGALFFFHPAVWWLQRKASLEREMACDDAVVRETGHPRSYAECLQHLAKRAFLGRAIALAQAALGRVRHTSLRIVRILDSKQPRSSKWGFVTVSSVAALLAVVAGAVGEHEPRLIAFSDSSHVEQIAAHAAPGLKMIPTSFHPTEAVAPKLVSQVHRHGLSKRVAVKRVEGMAAPGAHNGLVRYADFHQQTACVSDAIFVVVETLGTNAQGAPLYRIEMLHITVLRAPVRAASAGTSQRQT